MCTPQKQSRWNTIYSFSKWYQHANGYMHTNIALLLYYYCFILLLFCLCSLRCRFSFIFLFDLRFNILNCYIDFIRRFVNVSFYIPFIRKRAPAFGQRSAARRIILWFLFLSRYYYLFFFCKQAMWLWATICFLTLTQRGSAQRHTEQFHRFNQRELQMSRIQLFLWGGYGNWPSGIFHKCTPQSMRLWWLLLVLWAWLNADRFHWMSVCAVCYVCRLAPMAKLRYVIDRYISYIYI